MFNLKCTSSNPALMNAVSISDMWLSTKFGRVLARWGKIHFPSSATKPSIKRQDSCISDGSKQIREKLQFKKLSSHHHPVNWRSHLMSCYMVFILF